MNIGHGKNKKTGFGVWRVVLAAAALWTMMGAIPAFIDPATTFERFHGHPAGSTELLAVYLGAWGQSMLFAIGYAIAAFDPHRHAAILLLGGIGKAVYAAGFFGPIAAQTAGPLALPAVIGDLVFAAAIAAFLVAEKPWRGGGVRPR